MNKTNNALTISIAITICTILVCITFLNRYPSRSTGYIEVKGMGQTNFESDLIVWEGQFSKQNKSLKLAYEQIATDKSIVEKFLLDKGISASEIVFGAVNTSKKSKSIYSEEGKIIGEEFTGYQLSQNVSIESKNVAEIEKISRLVTDVLNNGVQFYSFSPRYYFTELANLKLDLISKATEDARLRAEKIVDKSGASLDDLLNADMGILQIVGQNSDESYSWGGTFNTSSKKKTASITIELRYKIEN